jgi:outer membrane protein assembly factor BamB
MSKRFVLSVLLLLVSSAVPGSGAPASGSEAEAVFDWPQWRGPGRDAVSLETGLVDRWGEKGPDVIWRVAAGEGFSSVSVSGGKLYTLWDEQGKQILCCLDAATGKELWRRELGPAFKNHYGNGPRSTPLVDDGIVYTIGTAGLLLAANQRTGETVWQRDLVADFQSALPSYGYSSSPIAVGDRLMIEVGGKKGAFAALDKKTGETIWTSASDQSAYSSPIHIKMDGVSQVVFWSAHGLHSVSSESGDLLWKFPWETFCPVSGDPLHPGTPIPIAPDRIFLSSGSGAAVIRVIRTDGEFQVEEVWKSEQMRSDINTALLLHGQIYGFDRGTLKSLVADTGEVKWQARGFQRGALIAADGKLIVLGEGGNLALIDADPDKYVEKSSAKLLEGRNWTAPALAGGRLYLRNNEELVCVEMKRR